MNEAYTIKKISENDCLVIGPNGEPIKNHNDKIFPPLSKNIAQNLCGDLNDINDKNRRMLYVNSSKEGNALTLIHNELLGNELRESLAYCIISTMMEVNADDFYLDLRTFIQLDRVFRLNPDPEKSTIELTILEKAKTILKSNWVYLGKTVNRKKFLQAEIITELDEIVMALLPVERIIVDIVYNLLECFSIALPILWVGGKINEDYLVDVYWVFKHGIHPDNMEEDQCEEVRFLKNRLLYLKTIKWGYQWKDETLPQ